MDMESLNARNNFVKRTEVLGVYNINGAETTVSRAADADLVFDIARGGSVLSFAVSRSQHSTMTPYTRHMGGYGAPAYKGEHNVDYSLRLCLDGFSASKQISFVGAEYDEWKDTPVPPYDVDLNKGIPQSEHKKIGEELGKQNEDMAVVWNRFVPDSEQMASKNNVKSSAFNARLADFLHNGR